MGKCDFKFNFKAFGPVFGKYPSRGKIFKIPPNSSENLGLNSQKVDRNKRYRKGQSNSECLSNRSQE